MNVSHIPYFLMFAYIYKNYETVWNGNFVALNNVLEHNFFFFSSSHHIFNFLSQNKKENKKYVIKFITKYFNYMNRRQRAHGPIY